MNENEKIEINANDILNDWEFSDKALINRGLTEYRFDFAFTAEWGLTMKERQPCSHEINPNSLVNVPFEMWGRGVCLLCGENKPKRINDADGRDIIDGWLRTVY